MNMVAWSLWHVKRSLSHEVKLTPLNKRTQGFTLPFSLVGPEAAFGGTRECPNG